MKFYWVLQLKFSQAQQPEHLVQPSLICNSAEHRGSVVFLDFHTQFLQQKLTRSYFSRVTKWPTAGRCRWRIYCTWSCSKMTCWPDLFRNVFKKFHSSCWRLLLTAVELLNMAIWEKFWLFDRLFECWTATIGWKIRIFRVFYWVCVFAVDAAGQEGASINPSNSYHNPLQ